MFNSILSNIDSVKHPERYAALIKVIKINHCNLSAIKAYKLLHSFYEKQCAFIKSLFFSFWRCVRYFLKRIPFTKKYFIHKAPIKNDINLYISWNDAPNMSMQKASEMVMDLINKNINFEELKL